MTRRDEDGKTREKSGDIKKKGRGTNYIWIKEREYKTTIIPKLLLERDDRG